VALLHVHGKPQACVMCCNFGNERYYLTDHKYGTEWNIDRN